MRIVLTGGGTGGHIYPALAVAGALGSVDPSVTITYVGTSSGLEAALVPGRGLDFRVISSRGILGKSPLGAAVGAAAAARGAVEALWLLRKLRPAAVLGTGGYVSGPVVLAAVALGIPRAIQEQNAVPGFTNRALGVVADKVFLAFEEAADKFPASKVKITGNPVREEILVARRETSAQALGLDPSRFTVLILGGSRGARAIVDAGMRLLRSGLSSGIQVVFVTGREYFASASRTLRAGGINSGGAGNTILIPYMHNIEDGLACADLVVCRAGGMTVAEVTARGLPSVLVPSPNVANNHQERNAAALEKRGAAVVVKEGARFEERVEEAVRGLLSDRARLDAMRAAARSAGRPRAATEIALELLRMAGSRL
ncbi:MAG: undecaprenyldiphospho-muramoylpentapeptide beta-N-acetylglucosaminyltransferase [Firmicutes bacterium]|nr:undecaprenyldiphospho-muramoylpentapeptide beta-N-acetylglucosaminyltransferase [Bacillota bacterium]